MAQRIADDRWEVQGRAITLPVVIRDATAAVAVFCCSAAAARRALADDRLAPLTVAGRGIALLIVVQYHDSDLGSYDEVGLMIAVRGPGRGAIGGYLVELPVTQTFTLQAGRAIWGLPKWLARISTAFHRGRMRVHLGDGAEFVLTAALDAGRCRIPVPLTVPAVCWAVRPDSPDAGQLVHGAIRLRLQDLRIRLGGTRIVLGKHRMARTAQALGMSRRPLATAVARVTTELGTFTPAHGPPVGPDTGHV